MRGLATLLLLLAAPATAQAPPAVASRECTICHGRPEFKVVRSDGSIVPLFIDQQQLTDSVHARWQCVDCHADATRIPHPAPLARVNCQRCHFAGNSAGAPQDVDYDAYGRSVHGRLRQAGNTKAPTCRDCHGSHDVRSRTDASSRVSRADLPRTCGRCHVEVFAHFERSVHGQALLVKGNLEAPNCASCHGEHNIMRAREQGSGVSAARIPDTCSNCHGSMAFNTRFNIPIDPVKTFEHSFHGIANSLGSLNVAECSSCHTAHDVLPPQDPASSVNPVNIPATCGKAGCHEGANANYARGHFHIDPESKDSGVIYWVTLFFKILTASTMVALIAHILLDLVKKLRTRHEGGHVGE
jgi:hypothetical protein